MIIDYNVIIDVANQDGEPVVDENLQENSPQMDHPMILETASKKDKVNLKVG